MSNSEKWTKLGSYNESINDNPLIISIDDKNLTYNEIKIKFHDDHYLDFYRFSGNWDNFGHNIAMNAIKISGIWKTYGISPFQRGYGGFNAYSYSLDFKKFLSKNQLITYFSFGDFVVLKQSEKNICKFSNQNVINFCATEILIKIKEQERIEGYSDLESLAQYASDNHYNYVFDVFVRLKK